MRVRKGSISYQANAALAPYLRVALASGKLVAAGAMVKDIGTLEQRVLAANAYAAVVPPNVEGSVKMVAAGAFSQYAKLYGAAGGKVDDVANGNPIGIALIAATTDGDYVEVLRFAQFSTEISSSLEAAGTALTASTTETSLAAAAIDGTSLKVGDVIRVLAQVIASATNSTDTLTLKLYVGTEQVVSTGAVDVANGDIGFISCDIVIRAIGATGKIVAAGLQGLGVPGTVTAKPFLLAEATEDISGDFNIDLKGTWSTNSAGNSCRCDVLDVQVIRK